ncbi:hypothetical protein Tco_0351500 [Tanacetum coccineum]
MLKKLSSGIGGMTSLQFLSKVIIEGSNRFKISKLKGTMELRGMPMALELFPSLEVLELEDMQGWENWSVNNDNSDGSTILFHVFLRFL